MGTDARIRRLKRLRPRQAGVLIFCDAARLDLSVSRFASRRAPVVMLLNAAATDFSYGTPEEGQNVARRQALLLKALLNGELPPELERLKTA